MPLARRIDYMAVFDSGHASIRWPQKNPAEAKRNQRLFENEIAFALKSNLLWRPFVALRHFELFDNLALAKYALARQPTFQSLADADLIRVCSPKAASFADILQHWALATDTPMHWHHLTSETQGAYDRAYETGAIKDLPTLEPFLHLGEHQLSLVRMLKAYDKFFPSDKILVVGPKESATQDSYSQMVESKWPNHRDMRLSLGVASNILIEIENVLDDCCSRNARRREFFTRLENLGQSLNLISGIDPEECEREFKAVKSFVVNDAFYDEFELFRSLQCGGEEGDTEIAAARDVTMPWANGVPITTIARLDDAEDLLLREDMESLDSIRLEDIVEWRTKDYDEAKAFQESLAKLASYNDEAAPTESIREHITNIRKCARHTLNERNELGTMEATVLEVYTGFKSEVAEEVGQDTALKWALSHGFGVVPGLLIGAICKRGLRIVFRTKVLTEGWRHVEAIVKREVERNLTTPEKIK